MVNEMVELCTMILQLDPAVRATASDCLKVDYFSELNGMTIEEIVARASDLRFVYDENYIENEVDDIAIEELEAMPTVMEDGNKEEEDEDVEKEKEKDVNEVEKNAKGDEEMVTGDGNGKDVDNNNKLMTMTVVGSDDL